MSDDDYEPPPGILKKARSLPKLQVEEAAEFEEDHPGHRYLTPQPTKRKPFIPAKPSINNRRSFSPYSTNGIPDDIAEHPEEHNGGSNYLDPDGQGMRTHRAHSNTRLEEAKRDLVASSGPLTPRRKAPTLPSNVGNRRVRRRQSDTNASELIKLQRQKSSLSPDSSSPDTPGRPRKFLTPQPKRKQFNTERNKFFDTSDILHGTTRSPVERLAKMKMSQRSWGSSDSSDSTPSPIPQSVSPLSPSQSSRSPSSLSSSPTTPTSTSPKHLPISPLASPLKVTNTQNSPLKRITWTSTVDTTVVDSRPQRKLNRSRPQSFPERPVRNPKSLRKAVSGSSIRSTSGSSGIRKARKHRSVSTMSSILRSPDRNVDPVQSFGAAYQAEQSTTRQSRKSQALRDELFNSIILTKTEQASGMPLTVNTAVPMRSAPSAPVNRTSKTSIGDQENTQLIAKIARQKSGIDTPDGYFENEPPTPGSGGSPTSPSSGYNSTPSPTSSPHRPKFLRNMSSVSSMKSIFGSREVLNDLFLSDRGAHKGLKAFAGFITGLILGIVLFLGLYYGLKYGLIAAICITAVSTVFMSLCLAFTVRGRCVALLMVPTLCTQRGRAAFLAIVVALLLNGPINNIFHNANEVSTSMSCSAELAYNQSQQIKQVAAEVFDQYVRNLEKSVQNLQDLADGVQGVFEPIEKGLDVVQGGLNAASDVLSQAGRRCRQVIQGAYLDCTNSLSQAYRDCKRDLTASKAMRASKIEAICEVVNIGGACKLLRIDSMCEAPTMMDQWVDDAAQRTMKALQDMRQQFNVDVDFSLYWQERWNTSRSFEAIQKAVKQELDEKIDWCDFAFSIANKLLALSVLWLAFQSYQYHMKYRTKDRFDNFYITKKFKKLDAKRKEQGKPSLLPLKKSEKVKLVDLTQFKLSKPEKGLFKLGLLTVIMHSFIAGILVLVDYGLYALLELIRRHGQVKSEVSGEHSSSIDIKGTNAIATFIRETFINSFEAASVFNSTIDSDLCLPKAEPPNEYLSITIGALYLLAILTVLFQAYAMRLRRRIAAFYYPERELERLYYLYTHTQHKRQSLANFLQQRVKENQHELESQKRVSFKTYLALRYPRTQKLFRLFGIEKRICLGCANEDELDTFKTCATPKCPGRYCFECFQEIAGICSLCEGIIEEACEEALLEEVKKPKEQEICDWHYKYIDKSAHMANEKMIMADEKMIMSDEKMIMSDEKMIKQ